MAIFSIAWHKNCLNNFTINLQYEEAELKRQIANVERMRLERDKRLAQIKRAESEGRTGYDPERFKA